MKPPQDAPSPPAAAPYAGGHAGGDGAAHGGHGRAGLRGNALKQILSHRNYRLYTIGDGISLLGSWTQRVAIAWLTWELTQSAFWLGVVAFADLFPAVIFSPIGGVIADRGEPRRISMMTQMMAMAQSFTLFVLTWTDVIDMYLLVFLAAVRGALAAINQPARMSLVPSLVPRSDLPAALGMNSVLFNSARFVGPAIAGAIIVSGGIALAFAFNAATYLVLIWALWMIDVKPQPREHSGRRGVLSQIGAGYAYVRHHRGIGPLMLLFAATAMLARPVAEMLPGFADGIFERGAQGLAWMTSAIGLGAMIGGGSMIRRNDTAKLVNVSLTAAFLLSASVLAFALIPSFWIGLVLLFLFGFTSSTSGVGAQTLTQSAVDDAMRGRVMSLYGVIFRGGPAVGALLIGVLAEHLGLQVPVAIGGGICLLISVWALTRRRAFVAHLRRPADD